MFKAVKFFGGLTSLASAAFAVAAPAAAATLPLQVTENVREGTPIRPWYREGTPIRPWHREGTPIRPWHREGTPIRPW